LQQPEKFATAIWALLQSGYALLAQGPDSGILSTNPAELPLKESETVFKQNPATSVALPKAYSRHESVAALQLVPASVTAR